MEIKFIDANIHPVRNSSPHPLRRSYSEAGRPFGCASAGVISNGASTQYENPNIY